VKVGSDRLQRVAVYERTIDASLERIWENVRDWEHLPWLHRSTFRRIEHLGSGEWGWRARVWLQPEDVGGEFELELRIEAGRQRYVARTLAGVGEGTEIWTRLSPRDAKQTDIRVEFLLPRLEAKLAAAMGEGYRRLYRQLWDEDESMMQRRTALLSAPRRPGADRSPVALGPLDALRARLPLQVESAGRTYRVIELAGELLAHATVCPHLLGPLEEAEIEGSSVRCPWHGYRFDLRSGRSCDGHRLRLPPAPRVEVGGDSQVRLVWDRG
jgi:nitrite reductase/ring-hydroxylating ferredoxin subunit